jgi:hypothetical protein
MGDAAAAAKRRRELKRDAQLGIGDVGGTVTPGAPSTAAESYGAYYTMARDAVPLRAETPAPSPSKWRQRLFSMPAYVLALFALGLIAMIVAAAILSWQANTRGVDAAHQAYVAGVEAGLAAAAGGGGGASMQAETLAAPTLPTWRTFDGTDNQPGNRGAAGTPLIRLVPPASAQQLAALPAASTVAATVFSTGETLPPPNSGGTVPSAWLWMWGQWVAHQLVETTMAAPASVQFVSDATTSITNGRASFLDASTVYGSDAATALLVRGNGNGAALARGTLAMNGTLLPGWPLFVCGDDRCNQHSWLEAVHVLWAREHNYWVARLHAAHPAWTGDQLYQVARWAVVGEIQAITYNEWLPALLGAQAYAAYVGADPTAPPAFADYDPTVSVEFDAALNRFGHTMVAAQVGPRYTLAQGFAAHAAGGGNPALDPVRTDGADAVLASLHLGAAAAVDLEVTAPMRTVHNLPLLDVERSRLYRVASYAALVEAAFGADVVPAVRGNATLAQQYGAGTWRERCDALVGAIAEVPTAPDALVGPTLAAFIGNQMLRVRNGDAYYHAWDAQAPATLVSAALRKEVASTRLAYVVRRNMYDSALRSAVPDAVFFVKSN